jgi:hypothetical protein
MDNSDILNKLLNVQQSIRAEQNQAGISEIAKRQEEEFATLRKNIDALSRSQQAEASRHENVKALKQAIFNVRQSVDQVIAQQDPFVCYSVLDRMRPPLESLDLSDLENLSDKEYHTETLHRLAHRVTDIAAVWGDSLRASVDSLCGLLAEVDGRAEAIKKQNDLENARKVIQAPSTSWLEELDQLDANLKQIRCLAATIPGLNLTVLPTGGRLQQLETGVIQPHRQRMFVFKALVLVAKADGAVNNHELGFLKHVASTFRLNAAERDRLIAETTSISVSDVAVEADWAEGVVKNLYRCALLDGPVSIVEGRIVARIGKALRVTEERIADVLRGVGVEAMPYCDTVAAVDLLQHADAKALKSVLVGPGVGQDVGSRLRGRCKIPYNEELLAAYCADRTYKLCAVLTDVNLYVAGELDHTTPVPVADLRGATVKVGFSTQVSLPSGQAIKADVTLGSFLSLAQRVVASCAGAAGDKGKSVLDSVAAIQMCQTADPKSLKSCYCGGTVPQPVLDHMRSRFAIPHDEEVIIVLDDKALGIRASSGVLTDKSLYVTSNFDLRQVKKIDLREFRAIEAGAWLTATSTQVHLNGGEVFKAHRRMRDFLLLAEKVIQACKNA